ncbi:hypothetical protein SPBR_09125 [Sporothrix brasiliensis 5110]|uniref:Alpha/beta hydrolase fold-3 domain-containing protein n=1 Tax=Sporothrix brasiliensis 5110 TaxID=1398154 RepID=A0A0C2IZJ0_9PEZI|nr:uncharacterized protein SPBR_09125 [Sporothrix brasiliensis 5110]KIH92130.1 hypothetical protein SPBR_09125 [Sporothrix brasiliensis 5110]
MAPSSSSPSSSSSPPLNPIHLDMVGRLDPRFVEYYNKNLAHKEATHQVPLAEVRANPAAWARPWIQDDDPDTKDWTVPSTDGAFVVRVYHPDASRAGPGPYPVHINFHGGGWVFGDLTSDAAICRQLRDRLPIVAVDVDYRLCPEFPFGRNVEDAWEAFEWVRANAAALHVRPDRVSIGGTSAGGLLAVVVQHRARDAGLPLRLLVATVPALAPDDHARHERAEDSAWASVRAMRHTALLDWDRMHYLARVAMPPPPTAERAARQKHVPAWWVAPLEAPRWDGLCATFLATAECDILRDEGEAYGRRLVAAGNTVTMRRYLGVPHSFMQMTAVLPQATQYLDDVVEALCAAHEVE